MTHRGGLRVAVVLLPAVLLARTPAAAQTPAATWLCVGRVTSADTMALPGVQITLTTPGDTGPALEARTDAEGRYRLACPARSGGYVVRATRIGFASQWRAVPAGVADTLRADFVLSAVAQPLAPVETRGARPVVTTRADGRARLPGSDLVNIDVASGNPMGDLGAALAMVPDITVTPGGLSAYGQSPDQMGTTLNGMESAGSLPRDGLQPSLYLSTYDPRQGHFGAAELSFMLPSGSSAPTRFLHGTAQDLDLRPPGRASAFSGAPDRNVLSGVASGPLPGGRTFYDATFQFDEQLAHVSPLDAAPASVIDAAGLEPDSIAALRSAATFVGLPVSPSSRQLQATRAGAFASRFDFTPAAATRQLDTGAQPADEAYAMMSGGWRTSDGVGLDPATFASAASSRRHVDGQLIGEYVTYRAAPVTLDTKASLSATSDDAGTATAIPQAAVLTEAETVDGSVGTVPILLGGSAGLRMHAKDLKAEINSDAAWYTWNRSHHFDVFMEGEAEQYRVEQTSNADGTFAFNSVEDLRRGTPAVYTRTLGEEGATVPAVRFSAALSDIFAPGQRTTAPSTYDPGIMVQYGVRLDYEHYGAGSAGTSPLASEFQLDPGPFHPPCRCSRWRGSPGTRRSTACTLAISTCSGVARRSPAGSGSIAACSRCRRWRPW